MNPKRVDLDGANEFGTCNNGRSIQPMRKRINQVTRASVAGEPPAEPVQVAGAGGQIDTTSPQEEPSAPPALPHERDEKVGMTGGVQSARVQQGARDLKRGLQDTTRATEADAAYKKQKR